MTIGSKIGKSIRIDDATSTVSRGHYARICVEIDLLKPMVAKFKLRRRVGKLEYKGLHLVCFVCGLYGHREEPCPHEKREPSIAPEPTTGEEPIREIERQDEGETNEVEAANNPEVTDTFGPWMLDKQFRLRYSSQQRNKRGNEEQKKGSIWGKQS